MSKIRKNILVVLAVSGIALVLYVIMQSLSSPTAARNPLKAFATGQMQELVLLEAPPAQPLDSFAGPDGPVTLADFRGKVVLLNLWASWCGPCVEELPSLDRLQGALGSDDFMVLAVDMDRSRAEAEAFLKKTDIQNLPLYHDNRFALAQKLSVPGLPSGLPLTVLYDKNGIERARLSGGADWNGKDARALIAAVQE
jgi:thiol-disulfide isomerase/thioredoxin